MRIKSSLEMIEEVLTIQDGHFKDARVTPTIEMIAKLMEDYHEQFKADDNERY